MLRASVSPWWGIFFEVSVLIRYPRLILKLLESSGLTQ